jgi:hypothetical protein
MTRFIAYFCLVTLGFAPIPAFAGHQSVVGWVEKIHIDQLDASFPAKLDTGATTSSLGAMVIKVIKPEVKARGNHGSVVFSVVDDNEQGRVLERKIQRWVRIKTKDGGFIRRPVVKLTFCVANELITEEVNLADRTDFLYPVLIGRNMMQEGKLAIDASRTFTAKPNCKP